MTVEGKAGMQFEQNLNWPWSLDVEEEPSVTPGVRFSGPTPVKPLNEKSAFRNRLYRAGEIDGWYSFFVKYLVQSNKSACSRRNLACGCCHLAVCNHIGFQTVHVESRF